MAQTHSPMCNYITIWSVSILLGRKAWILVGSGQCCFIFFVGSKSHSCVYIFLFVFFFISFYFFLFFFHFYLFYFIFLFYYYYFLKIWLFVQTPSISSHHLVLLINFPLFSTCARQILIAVSHIPVFSSIKSHSIPIFQWLINMGQVLHVAWILNFLPWMLMNPHFNGCLLWSVIYPHNIQWWIRTKYPI